jgi:hypothetical protein
MEALIADLSAFHVDAPIEGVSGEFHTLTAHPAVRPWDWTVMGTGIVVGGILAILLALIGLAAIIVLQVDQVPAPVQSTPIAQPPPRAAPAAKPAAEPPPKEAAPAEAEPVRKQETKPRRRTSRGKDRAPEPRVRDTPRKKKPRTDLRDPWAD